MMISSKIGRLPISFMPVLVSKSLFRHSLPNQKVSCSPYLPCCPWCVNQLGITIETNGFSLVNWFIVFIRLTTGKPPPGISGHFGVHPNARTLLGLVHVTLIPCGDYPSCDE